jgi:hypothetical protein
MTEQEPRPQLAVQQLIDKLNRLEIDRRTLVRIEGCDCYGDAYDVEVYEGKVLITRTDT